jgi:4-amino-4-deoxychorismate lyase
MRTNPGRYVGKGSVSRRFALCIGSTVIYTNFWHGTTLAITCDEPALLYGATVFTTLRVYSSALDHPLTLWQAHCDRLRHTLDHFSWPHPPWTSLHQGAVTMAQHYPVLRITCWPDGRELITGRPLPQELAQRQQQGISAWLAESANYHRPLANFKTGNYLGGWLALASRSAPAMSGSHSSQRTS